MSYFPLLYSLTYTERCATKSPVRANHARPREVQAKKQQSATLHASSKPAGGAAAATKHRDAASAAKKASKTTGKTGSSTPAKASPRNTNNTNRGNGKFRWVRRRLTRQNSHLYLHHCMENVLVAQDDSQQSHQTPVTARLPPFLILSLHPVVFSSSPPSIWAVFLKKQK